MRAFFILSAFAVRLNAKLGEALIVKPRYDAHAMGEAFYLGLDSMEDERRQAGSAMRGDARGKRPRPRNVYLLGRPDASSTRPACAINSASCG